ncbi:MAG: hypothetical protein DI562_18110 [Stenotrophomonas acidaminiphila]|nr:MAG: hypothetical protein DI562_18110 [Stenotrophomonas acidaminiphila]
MLSKERFAWVWLTALVVVFAIYFTYVSVNADAVAAMHVGQRIGLLAIALGSLGVIALLTAVFGRHREEDGTPTPIDERDRRIDSRASVYAYYVLMSPPVAGPSCTPRCWRSPRPNSSTPAW